MDVMGWLGVICVLLSVWFYGRDSRLGPVFGLIGCAAWCYVGVTTRDAEITVLNGVLAVLHVCAKQNWRK